MMNLKEWRSKLLVDSRNGQKWPSSVESPPGADEAGEKGSVNHANATYPRSAADHIKGYLL